MNWKATALVCFFIQVILIAMLIVGLIKKDADLKIAKATSKVEFVDSIMHIAPDSSQEQDFQVVSSYTRLMESAVAMAQYFDTRRAEVSRQMTRKWKLEEGKQYALDPKTKRLVPVGSSNGNDTSDAGEPETDVPTGERRPTDVPVPSGE